MSEIKEELDWEEKNFPFLMTEIMSKTFSIMFKMEGEKFLGSKEEFFEWEGVNEKMLKKIEKLRKLSKKVYKLKEINTERFNGFNELLKVVEGKVLGRCLVLERKIKEKNF